MIPVTSFKNRTVAVFGLGASGLATAAALKAGGAHPILDDDTAARRAEAQAQGYDVRSLRDIDWNGVAALVLSPGVPLTHPAPHWSVGLARNAAVEVIGDIELFARERRLMQPDSPFIAITGTNGKSTTTALIAHVLQAAGRDVQLGGNFGTAILSLAPPAPGRAHVVECSSFQIDLAPTLDPAVGVLLNLTPDHLDRHGTMADYAAIKERLVQGVQPGGTAVVGVDDTWCQAIADRLERAGTKVVRLSVRRPLADGLYLDGNEIVLAEGGAKRFSVGLAGIGSLRGVHNAQNAAAAFAATTASGVAPAIAAAALKSFPGLAHRMEEVGRRGNVLFINDSKATNADAAARALASFEDVYWIAGGKPKAGGIASLTGFFPRIAKAYLIGAAAEEFASTLGDRVPHVIAGTLDNAVELAAADAAAERRAHPVVLLSPACASYDQFRHFEERGARFAALVGALPETGASGTAS